MNKNYAFIKLFKKNSLFWKYYKRTLLIIILPFILLFSVFSYYSNLNTKTKSDNFYSQAFLKQKILLENKLEFIEHESYSYMTDNSVIEMLTSINVYNSKFLNDVLKMMKKTISLNGISSISIYSTLNEYVLSTRISGFINDISYKPWFDKFSEDGVTNFIILTKSSETSYYNEICIARGIFQNDKLLGIIIFNYPISGLFENTSENENLFLVSGEDIIASTGIMHTSYEDFSFSDFLHCDARSRKYADKYFFKSNMDASDLTLISIFDEVTPEKSIAQFLLVFLMFLFAIMLPFVLSLYLASNYYNSLAEILLSSVNSDKNLEILSSDNELSFIKEYISANKKYVLQLEEELDDNISKLKFAQTAALQMQFNPHFLFNTLNLINMKAICLTKSENDVSQTVSILADILKTSLDTDNYLITVTEEMKLAEKYLCIEQMRYKDRFDVVWDIEDDTKNIHIAKFIIQPIVENALKHGIHMLPPDKKGILKISARISGDYLNITVSNNGYCSPEQLAQIQNIINEDDNIINASHIGLKNVNSRLKIFFGDKYFCSVTSLDEYTNITLHIPINGSAANSDIS